jgi:hypothetical protein
MSKPVQEYQIQKLAKGSAPVWAMRLVMEWAEGSVLV